MNETTAQRPAENKMGVMPINRLLITMSLPMVVPCWCRRFTIL